MGGLLPVLRAKSSPHISKESMWNIRIIARGRGGPGGCPPAN
jgi:hypothetical protein